ncbi:helix-hairpin-helix domain-containing protein [Egicoccus sp. AB-alg2]|uniref:helix-hairpin-helix domain-containing protein n=1 Tax=Egicoccus sp. AB-alg2 TaxID=3242693 RepID=UPI00359E22EF
MILLSLVLVIAAAVLLVVGWFQDGLQLVYLSIGACLLSMLLLGASVLVRRGGEVTVPRRPSPAAARTPVGTGAEATAAADAGARPVAGDPGAGRSTTDRTDQDAADTEVAATTAEDPARPVTADTTTPSAEVEDEPAPAASPRTRRAAVVRPGRPGPDPHDPSAEEAGADADPLAGVRGLGPSRREALLERFGSVDGIRGASEADLAEVPGLTPQLARAVKAQLDR